MSAPDFTGRTNGAGDHFWLAGREYIWVVSENGRLKAERWLNKDGIPRFPDPESLAKVLLGTDTPTPERHTP